MNFTSQGLTANRIARINSLTEDHPISVQIFEAPDDDGDGDNDSTMVTFSRIQTTMEQIIVLFFMEEITLIVP